MRDYLSINKLEGSEGIFSLRLRLLPIISEILVNEKHIKEAYVLKLY